MSDTKDDEISWRQKEKGMFLGEVAGACHYYMEMGESNNEWWLFRNKFPLEAPIAFGRISFLMRIAEIHLIRGD
jgi:hypothetical protein